MDELKQLIFSVDIVSNDPGQFTMVMATLTNYERLVSSA